MTTNQAIDAIYSSSPPICSHLVAYLLKRSTGKPWVAVYQDEYSFHPLMGFPTKLHREIAYRVDKMVLRGADAVIGSTEGYTRAFARLAGASNPTKFVTITNGFDPEDFPNLGKPCPPTANKVFTISYVGSFHPGAGDSLIQAVEELLEEGQIPSDRFKLVLVGITGRTSFTNDEFQHVIHSTGFVKHDEAIAHMIAADALLLAVTSQRGADNIPGKTFEYIASGRPILATVPPGGCASDVIARTRTGIVVDVDDVPAIKAAVVKMYRQWELGELGIDPNWEAISGYNRLELVRRIADILDSLVT